MYVLHNSFSSPLWNTVSDEDRKQHLHDKNGELWYETCFEKDS